MMLSCPANPALRWFPSLSGLNLPEFMIVATRVARSEPDLRVLAAGASWRIGHIV
jgi:hypothetical protein